MGIRKKRNTRLTIITGKGGVGKSVTAAALGIRLAAAGRRAVIYELNTAGSISYIFNREAESAAPVFLGDQLYTQVLTPEQCLKEYGLMKLKFKTLFKIVFHNPIIRGLTDFIPGMDELLIIGKIAHEVNSGAWDNVIIDAPPTGECLNLLRLPRVIMDIMKVGPMADDAGRIQEMLLNKAVTALIPVTIPEELPVNETIEFMQRLSRKVDIHMPFILINRMYPQAFSDQEQEIYRHANNHARTSGVDLTSIEDCVRFFNKRRALQDHYLKKLFRRMRMESVYFDEVFRYDSVLNIAETNSHKLDLKLL